MDTTKKFLLCYDLKILLLDALLNYGTNTMLKNGTLSPPSGPMFNITHYSSSIRGFASSNLN
jgi:hypothetical protein